MEGTWSVGGMTGGMKRPLIPSATDGGTRENVPSSEKLDEGSCCNRRCKPPGGMLEHVVSGEPQRQRQRDSQGAGCPHGSRGATPIVAFECADHKAHS